jgi:phage gp45-like
MSEKNLISQLSARFRNLFSLGDLQKRYDDGRIQVKTAFARVIEKKEAFPYGFKAKAKKGRVLVFCQGGNFDGFELLPVLDDEGGPDLQPGDVALYTESGSVICRDNGSIEITGSDVSIQQSGLPAARQNDHIQSTALDDPDFWKWVISVSSIVASLSGGSLTPPTSFSGKIIDGSTTVKIG